MRHLKDFEFIEGVVRAGSIRKASEDMNITASALNRRINKFEEEFGYEIFERLPRGVRLNPAGEMLMQHIRTQNSDFARLKSQVADLSGVPGDSGEQWCDELDAVIVETLGFVGQSEQADRCFILQVDEDAGDFTNTHE